MPVLNGTVGKVEVLRENPDGSLDVRITPGDDWDLSSSKKSYIAAFASDSVFVNGSSMRLAVTYTENIPKAHRSADAAVQKRNPFRNRKAA